ncbi:MAG: zinc permease [Bergeyella sp.]|nr:zinc permease [Bergeyella sp.]
MTITLLLILGIFLGAGGGVLFYKKSQVADQICLVGIGFLIMICFDDIFPLVYQKNIPHIGIFVIFGILLQVLLEYITKGFEHKTSENIQEKKSSKISLGIITGLSLHAFIEGIPLSGTKNLSDPYLWGILVHNFPISFLMGTLWAQNKKKSAFFLVMIVLFSIATPLGIILGSYIDTEKQPYFLAIVAGIFIHLCSAVLFDSHHGEQKKKLSQILYIFFGMILACVSHFFH